MNTDCIVLINLVHEILYFLISKTKLRFNFTVKGYPFNVMENTMLLLLSEDIVLWQYGTR